MKAIQDLQEQFEFYLKDQQFDQQPQELYTPVNYIMQLGGKRLRPVLLLMAYKLFNADLAKAMPAAYAVEIFHNFSLVHDDIMDKAPLRRGKATVHEAFGTNSGILSGDVMLIYAYKYLVENASDKQASTLLHAFNKVAIEVCEGQQMDMNFEIQDDVSIEMYLRMIELKTAALIGGSIEIGAILGGAGPEDVKNLAMFGRNIGIAFQLQDDILDTFGNPEKFGKKVGGDIAQNKKTFLMLKALETADKETKLKLAHYMTDGSISETEKIKVITEIFRNLNISNFAETLKEQYRQKAFICLDAVKVAAEKKSMLEKLALRFIEREV